MSVLNLKSILSNKEVWIQTLFWVLFLAAINVNWRESWILESFLPHSVAPHIALACPIIFFLNTYWLIPKYLNKKNWIKYIWVSITFLLGFELLRSLIFSIQLQNSNSLLKAFQDEVFGENSLVFGLLNVLIFHIIFYSFVYRFTRDWLINQSIIEKLQYEKKELKLNSLQLAGHVELFQNTFDSSNFVNQHKVETLRKVISVKKRDGVFLLKVEDVIFFQAQGDFIFAFDLTGNKHIINESLKSIKGQICQNLFFQINRSEIVNFNFITKFNSYTKSRLEISLLKGLHILYTSNSKSPLFRDWIDSH